VWRIQVWISIQIHPRHRQTYNVNEIDEEGDFFADRDEYNSGHYNVDDLFADYSQGFVWDCCDKLGDHEGCQIRPHTPRDWEPMFTDLDDSLWRLCMRSESVRIPRIEITSITLVVYSNSHRHLHLWDSVQVSSRLSFFWSSVWCDVRTSPCKRSKVVRGAHQLVLFQDSEIRSHVDF